MCFFFIMDCLKKNLKTIIKSASIAFSVVGASSQIMAYLNYSLNYIAPICFIISFTLIIIFMNMKRNIEEKIEYLFNNSDPDEIERITSILNERLTSTSTIRTLHLPNNENIFSNV